MMRRLLWLPIVVACAAKSPPVGSAVQYTGQPGNKVFIVEGGEVGVRHLEYIIDLNTKVCLAYFNGAVAAIDCCHLQAVASASKLLGEQACAAAPPAATPQALR